ncbi:MAG: FAD-dependent oxidoreductase [Symploca sp. SIO2E9]|nr:FAD-dependent oxidoreductase [Symploca sp. SIO2E9]
MMTKLLENLKPLNQTNTDTYDVVICGGGLAGLTLARQLKLNMPNISIAVLDRLSRTLPTATFKVGESTVEFGAYYLSHTLQLENYFREHHLPKPALRFFLGNPQDSLKDRPELGSSELHEPYAYQIDRGLLENDLRNFNTVLGIKLLENCSVQDVILSDNQNLHKIVYKQIGNQTTQTIQTSWVVDAMGRRRFLQNKLGLAKPNNEPFSAVWFRINDRVDVNDFVPVTEEQWHSRVGKNMRYYSTNHLVGYGYWVWLIPLSSGYTSIGIVTNEDIHPLKEYHTYEKAYKWLEKHEPVLAAHLKEQQPSDFKKMPNYSYSSTQVFSLNRWACVGEAGTFIDPLYSAGTDMIGIANSFTTEIIGLDLKNQLTQGMVDYANSSFLTLNELIHWTIRLSYQIFGKNSVACVLKLIWDILIAWSIIMPPGISSVLIKPERMAKLQNLNEEFLSLSRSVYNLLDDWSNKSLNRLSFKYIDTLGELPFVKELHERNLKPNKTDREIRDDYVASLEILEEFAQVIFLLALEDTMPDQLALFPSTVWLNAWAISLDPDRWESDGLFKPQSQPRDFTRVMQPLRKSIRLNSLVQASRTDNLQPTFCS